MEKLTVVLGFGPQEMDWLSRAAKICGKDAVLSPDVARMAGANFACGDLDALAALRGRLEAGALQAAQSAAPGLSQKAIVWLASGSRGISSNTMFSHLTGIDALDGYGGDVPHDPDDLDRCLALLKSVPELRAQLPRMAEVSPQWAALVNRWDEVEQSHLNEVGLGWTKASSAPKTFKLMREVFASVS